MALIDEILSSYAIEDRVVILDIARRYRLDDDDPSFVLLLATGALERLLEAHPDRLRQVLTEILAGEAEQHTALISKIHAFAEMQSSIQSRLESTLNNSESMIMQMSDQAVRGAIAKQAGAISKGINAGIKVNLMSRIAALIPVIAISSAVLFTGGLLTGIVVTRSALLVQSK